MRLTNVKNSLSTLKPRLARPADPSGHSAQAEPWRRWYSWAAWKRLRWTVLTRDLFTCQMDGCGLMEGDTSKLVADHKAPHRGDPTLFWDETNLWTLCASCHSSRKQALERRGQA